jgi:DNA mismatch endonuclease (patch repair protein)
VECDGDYWHGNVKVFPNLSKNQLNTRVRDAAQDILIRKAGWKVIRIWESDIQKDVSKCVDKIEEALKKYK